MPRFVVLEHDHPVLHWDLMLEAGEGLRTWRLASTPFGETWAIAAEPLPDHRLAYLEYEGPVSGNRGHVKRWDTGEFVNVGPDTWRFLGQRLQGVARIVRAEIGWRFERVLASCIGSINPPTPS